MRESSRSAQQSITTCSSFFERDFEIVVIRGVGCAIDDRVERNRGGLVGRVIVGRLVSLGQIADNERPRIRDAETPGESRLVNAWRHVRVNGDGEFVGDRLRTLSQMRVGRTSLLHGRDVRMRKDQPIGPVGVGARGQLDVDDRALPAPRWETARAIARRAAGPAPLVEQRRSGVPAERPTESRAMRRWQSRTTVRTFSIMESSCKTRPAAGRSGQVGCRGVKFRPERNACRRGRQRSRGVPSFDAPSAPGGGSPGSAIA